MGKTVLLIAFHFPPAAMGSGHLRTLGFARYLPASGWRPIVLAARAIAYPRTAPIAAGTIPAGCKVERALAFDAGRHFAIAGKYPGWIAQPDRWASWWPAAMLRGLRLIRQHRVDAIWSTYPIMSAHCIARSLSRTAKLPWIADFRDPVASSVSAANPFAFASQQRWEQRVLRDAARVTFTTQGALRDHAARYPAAHAAGRLALIENGYDEAAFASLPPPAPPSETKTLVLLHSGLLYPDGRSPIPFFTALAQLKAAGEINADSVRIILRASGFEATYASALRNLGIADIVTLAPPVSNHEALLEQARADALLLFQGDHFDRQIPAKLYEYLRIGQPIFALVGAAGDTAAVLRTTGGAMLAPPADSEAIATQLLAFIRALREGRAPRVKSEIVAHYSRQAGAVSLANLLDAVIA
jgi:hypothetical protein